MCSALRSILIFVVFHLITLSIPCYPDLPPVNNSRVLLVCGVQLRDSTVIHNSFETGDIAALLKMWAIPFDILRLDRDTLSISKFQDRSGNAKYGTIIWTARQDQYPWITQDYSVLRNAVSNLGIGLIAIADRIREPVIQDLIGLSYTGSQPVSDSVSIIDKTHFITKTLTSLQIPRSEAFPDGFCSVVQVNGSDVNVLAKAGNYAQLTTRIIDQNRRINAAWIGGNPFTIYENSPSFMTILKRAIVWTSGVGIVKNYDKTILLRMDDPGSGEPAFDANWHYPHLTRDQVYQYITLPLQKKQARLSVFCVTEFPDINTRNFVRSSTVNITDIFGYQQNIVSDFAGLRDGIDSGVIDIQSHGLTHMNPDLSSPAPKGSCWWDGVINGEWNNSSWYREFYDGRRDLEIAADTQTAHLQTAANFVRNDFGTTPLAFVPSGNVFSGDRYVTGGSLDSIGKITISITGASPKTSYIVYFGPRSPGGALFIGTFTTDVSGNGSGVFRLPNEIIGNKDKYFIINRGSLTQFVTDTKIYNPYDFSFSFRIRDRREMTATEKSSFPGATDTLKSGTVTGSGQADLSAKICNLFTPLIAARCGYGLELDKSARYLGNDRVITFAACEGITTKESFRRGVPSIVAFHDVDIVNKSTYLSGFLDSIYQTNPDVKYMTAEEWCAYLHLKTNIKPMQDSSIVIESQSDSLYCRYFSHHSPVMTLYLSNEVSSILKNKQKIIRSIDGIVTDTINAATFINDSMVISLPSGLGMHSITFTPFQEKILGGDYITINTKDFTPGGGTRVLSADSSYFLDGTVVVPAGWTLKINPGTHIYGSFNVNDHNKTSTLVITPGSILIAEGKPDSAIVFTSINDNLKDSTDLGPGAKALWGGIVWCGEAPIANQSGTSVIPGLNGVYYGGNHPGYYGGKMKYVSIRHAGSPSFDSKMSSLGLYGLGDSTQVSNVEVFASGSDGICFRGGTVNTSYLSSSFNKDDMFDINEGYCGKNQFWFAVEQEYEGDRGGEWKGKTSAQDILVSRPTIYNYTFIGGGANSSNPLVPNDKGSQGIFMCDSMAGTFCNGIIVNFGSLAVQRGLMNDSLNKPAKPFGNNGDSIRMAGNIFFSCRGSNTWAGMVSPSADIAYLKANSNDTIDPALRSISRYGITPKIDPRPIVGSPALSGYVALPPDNSQWKWTAANYRGAFSTNNLWLSGWTALDETGVLSKLVTISTGGNYPEMGRGTDLMRISFYVKQPGAIVLGNDPRLSVTIDDIDVKQTFLSKVRNYPLTAGGYCYYVEYGLASSFVPYGRPVAGPHTIKIVFPLSTGEIVSNSMKWSFFQ